ncbi:hypothetical protein RJ640_017301, partial [Escallonia rubra]
SHFHGFIFSHYLPLENLVIPRPHLLILTTPHQWMLHLNLSFGDSLADIGNLVHLSAQFNEPPPHFGLPPYKETYFHGPTARCSDGRLVYFGLAFLPPYVGGKNGSGKSFGKVVNFAVAGATALDAAF